MEQSAAYPYRMNNSFIRHHIACTNETPQMPDYVIPWWQAITPEQCRLEAGVSYLRPEIREFFEERNLGATEQKHMPELKVKKSLIELSKYFKKK